MKKIIILFCSLIVAFGSIFANDYVDIKIVEDSNIDYHNHNSYESWYDTKNNNPAVVVWDLTDIQATKSEYSKLGRTSKFVQCHNTPTEAAYKKSGYDKGHMCPNNDRDWDKFEQLKTFRCCNICPQTHKLNAGSWKKYETYGHDLAKEASLVTIIAGPIYSKNVAATYLGSGKSKIRVPERFFKIFIINGEFYEAFIFEQNGNFEQIEVPDIEKLTNIKFVLK